MKALSASATLVDGRVQVRMPQKETGPLKQNNYGIALKRVSFAEKWFKKKGCFDIVIKEAQKLVDQGFVIKVSHENVDHGQSEWYMLLQAVFTPEKSTKVRLVFNSFFKGLGHLAKTPIYINSLPDVLTAWPGMKLGTLGISATCLTRCWYTRMIRFFIYSCGERISMIFPWCTSGSD